MITSKFIRIENNLNGANIHYTYIFIYFPYLK